MNSFVPKHVINRIAHNGSTLCRCNWGRSWGLIALLLVACAPSRMEQCGQLGEATRAVMDSVMAVHQNQIGKNAYDAEYERRQAEAWAQGSQTIQAVTVSDQRLQTIQADLAKAYEYAGTVTRQGADLIPENGYMTADLAATHNAYQQQAQEPIAKAVDALNRYCIGGS